MGRDPSQGTTAPAERQPRAPGGVGPQRADAPWNPPSGGVDVTALFALLAAAPILLPALGLRLSDFAFALPLAALAFAAIRCASVAPGAGAYRPAWIAFAAGAALATWASAAGLVGALLDELASTAFYLGSGGSLALLLGAGLLARASTVEARLDGLVEALIFAVLAVGLGIHFVALPGLSHGDVVLTLVFLVDLAALLLAGLTAIAPGDRARRRVGWAIVVVCGAAMAGDALVTGAASGQIAELPALTALLWAVAGIALALAADRQVSVGTDPADPAGAQLTRWMYTRLLMPMAAVIAIPAIVAGLALDGALETWTAVYFAVLFLVLLLLSFGRQAYLLVDNRRAIARERTLREEVVRRNDDLEALTGLATTMTQTLEEAPIMERGLGVLHLAARASSAALHAWEEGCLRVKAVTGAWYLEHPWADAARGVPDAPAMALRGGRQILRLPLLARGNRIGAVTLLRPAEHHFDEEEQKLLRLLTDQLAIALQNARDYRERLEQSLRDPLTGAYNRRFFYEALEKEVQRARRYGSSVSVVFFDVDDFKSINDDHGHAAGDDALRAVASIIQELVRSVDSLARVGGEEFGLLLPETEQLDALLIAERVRASIARHPILSDRRITVSGGVSSCPSDASARDELEHKADAALYWAKRNGKNICAVASEVIVTAGEEKSDGTLRHLHALVSAIDAEPLHTRDHSQNVAAYAVALGQALGLRDDRIARLRRAALFHDIGKIAVSREILAKQGPLTEEELTEVRIHPGVGALMLLHAGLGEEAGWVRQHHEQMDGGGYPDGLEAGEIALEARIILVGDAFEAMTSDRPYRKSMGVERALAELRRCAGTQFDPEIVAAMEELVANDRLAVPALREPEIV